ncbi:MAG: hypothetical protein ACRD0P_12860 [Stackebrandtia sp.]
MDTVMQRENETDRVILDGRRTDDGARCTLVAIREYGGTWALYPHGANQLGIRLATQNATAMAHAILAVGK